MCIDRDYSKSGETYHAGSTQLNVSLHEVNAHCLSSGLKLSRVSSSKVCRCSLSFTKVLSFCDLQMDDKKTFIICIRDGQSFTNGWATRKKCGPVTYDHYLLSVCYYYLRPLLKSCLLLNELIYLYCVVLFRNQMYAQWKFVTMT